MNGEIFSILMPNKIQNIQRSKNIKVEMTHEKEKGIAEYVHRHVHYICACRCTMCVKDT